MGLLWLEDGAHRNSIRSIAKDRLAQIDKKVADLQRMQTTLTQLIAASEHTRRSLPCPIIASLVEDGSESIPRTP